MMIFTGKYNTATGSFKVFVKGRKANKEGIQLTK